MNARARLSLDGLSTGDGFGQLLFADDLFPPNMRRTGRRELPPPVWLWTDDTHMALSIVEVLESHGEMTEDELARAFTRRFLESPFRGYGPGAARLLSGLARGGDWRELAPALFDGGSFGNGAAMRAAPIGAFYAGDPKRAAAEADRSARVTHAHPEGRAGAIAVAVAAAWAGAENPPGGRDLLEAVLPHVPPGETHSGIAAAMRYAPDQAPAVAAELGTGNRISAQDTVPWCLWCAAHHGADYEEALWITAAGSGDVDTTCAIVGGIVALSSRGVPEEWLSRREPLHDLRR